MNPQDLIFGIKFCEKHSLTTKELKVLVPFLERDYECLELSEKLGMHKVTLHGVIGRLRLKGLIVFKDRDKMGTNLYGFDKSQLDN